jgi:seryl-tRNA synthetase
MIDLTALRADPQRFAAAWSARGDTVVVDDLLAQDTAVRELKAAAESKRAEANAASKAIGQAARNGEDIGAAKAAAKKIGDQARELDAQRAEAESDLHNTLLRLPNICLEEVPVGASENDNSVISTWGEQPEIEISLPHWDIGEELNILDLTRGAKIGGSGFAVLRGAGARLQRGLVQFFLDRLTKHDYTELAVPYLVRPEIMQGTGQLPKFADQLYACADDDLLLIPTAEVPVTNLHSGEILDADAVPLRYCAHTPCFRREAGAAGVGTRGITRVHQFDKVEMVWLTPAERSYDDFLTLRSHAEGLLQELELPYRVLQLCTGDTGFSAACTHDLEVWSPGTESWLEVSSCSTFTDFQARRANLRYRAEKGGKPQFLHTLNGSGLALPRVWIALLENGQQADGSVVLPAALQPFVGGSRITSDRIED